MAILRKPPQYSATQAAQHQALRQQYQQAVAAHQAQMQQAMYSGTQGTTVGSLFNSVTSTATNTWVSVPIGLGTTLATTSVPTSALQGRWVGVAPRGQPYDYADDIALKYDIEITDGEAHVISFPDGTTIDVAVDGSFTINDKDAKVTYRANRVRDFNSFVNASDKLEGFITFCKIVGIKQGEMLDIPIKHFIAWLIIEAALADGEPKPQMSLVPDLRRITTPRCRCGRFLARKHIQRKIAFCRPVCLERELEAA